MTTVTSTKTATRVVLGSGLPKGPGSNGNGSNGNGRRRRFGGRKRFSKESYRITTWVLIAAVVMMFVALASSYFFLSGGEQWQPVRVPRTFILSTGLIVISSLTIERARRALHHGDRQSYARWLSVTLLFGFAFVFAQLVGWRQLVREGVYLSGNPHASFFYLFTGAHGIHLLGGITALSYLVLRAQRVLIGVSGEKRLAVTDSVALYWHFMDGLWVALFLLLILWN